VAGKFFGKVFDFIGLEESTLDEEEYGYDDGYNDGYEDDYDDYDDGYDSRSRGGYYEDDGYEDDYEDDYASSSKKSGRLQGGKVRTIGKKRDREPVAAAQNFDNMRGLSGANSGKMKMVVYQPMTYDDTQSIIDNLKNRKPIVVNLENLEIDIAQRVLDFMSGAVYALNGNIHKVTKGIFILVPTNVDISGNIPDDLQGSGSFYTLGGSGNRRQY
jgi:FtsZ-interacting cell division protein YlmF